jgi:di/tricarboxylate transporter
VALHVPIELAMLTGVVALLLAKLVTPDEAYAEVPWRVIFLIAGTLSVSVAMVQTGLAAQLGEAMIRAAEPFGPAGLVVGTVLLSSVSTELMGGQVSPLVVGPIAISAAITLKISPQLIAIVTAVANSVSFITPLTHPVNVLMLAPGNLTFGDFVKSGWALTAVCFVALIVAALLFWRL